MSVETRFSSHTAYRLSFFLLRVPLNIGGQPAHTTVSDDGHLTLGCSPVSITFDSLTTEVDNIVKKYGVEGVSNYWCAEDVPLFELRLSSQDGLKKLLRSQEKVQNEIKSRIDDMLAQKSPDPAAAYARTEVYMLTPRPESKDARIVRVSSEKDLDTCTTIWRESEVFNFGALFRAFSRDTPNQGKLQQCLYVCLLLVPPLAQCMHVGWHPILQKYMRKKYMCKLS